MEFKKKVLGRGSSGRQPQVLCFESNYSTSSKEMAGNGWRKEIRLQGTTASSHLMHGLSNRSLPRWLFLAISGLGWSHKHFSWQIQHRAAQKLHRTMHRDEFTAEYPKGTRLCWTQPYGSKKQFLVLMLPRWKISSQSASRASCTAENAARHTWCSRPDSSQLHLGAVTRWDSRHCQAWLA